MCSCHSILECCVTFSGVKLSIRLFVLFIYLLDGISQALQLNHVKYQVLHEKSSCETPGSLLHQTKISVVQGWIGDMKICGPIFVPKLGYFWKILPRSVIKS